jgi:hypothetical protein
MKQQLSNELRRLAVMDKKERQVLLARTHIEEEILQMRCPRPNCRRAFYDFDGCFAISCSSCPCKFCGWCLQDCGDADAHTHCRQCPKVPPGVNSLFPLMPDPRSAFEYAHKERCIKKIQDYFQTLDNETMMGVKKALAKQLIDLGLDQQY